MRDGVSIITAFVVPAESSAWAPPDPMDLIAHARAHLAAYKCPREVVFVPALPRTANGKILRRHLRAGTTPGG